MPQSKKCNISYVCVAILVSRYYISLRILIEKSVMSTFLKQGVKLHFVALITKSNEKRFCEIVLLGFYTAYTGS
jgi:type IV secretory pathway VirB3-like protein